MFITYRQRQGTAHPRIKYIGVDEYFWEEKHLFYACILYCNNAWELREAFRLRQLAALPGYGQSFIVELYICLASKQGGEKNPHNILQSHLLPDHFGFSVEHMTEVLFDFVSSKMFE